MTLERRDVFWAQMNNVATLLGFYEQRRDVEHGRRDVVGFSNDGKLIKILTLGLLISSNLFLLHNNHL